VDVVTVEIILTSHGELEINFYYILFIYFIPNISVKLVYALHSVLDALILAHQPGNASFHWVTICRCSTRNANSAPELQSDLSFWVESKIPLNGE